MKHAAKSTALFLFALLVLPVLFSCQDPAGGGSGTDDPVIGSWALSSYGESWEITATTVSYSSTYGDYYTADIIKRVDSQFNSGDTLIATGNSVPAGAFGYMIIQYTSVAGPGTGTVGKYNVFRWQENGSDSSARDFTQGYLGDGTPWPDNTNVLFDTALAAESGATVTAGYFGGISPGAERE